MNKSVSWGRDPNPTFYSVNPPSEPYFHIEMLRKLGVQYPVLEKEGFEDHGLRKSFLLLLAQREPLRSLPREFSFQNPSQP